METYWRLYLKKKYTASTQVQSYKIIGDDVIDIGNVLEWNYGKFLQPSGNLPSGDSYFIFRDGIIPMWEHPMNKNGGKWATYGSLVLGNEAINREWVAVVKYLLANRAEDTDNQVCGAQMNIYDNTYGICIWTSDKTEKYSNIEIGKNIQTKLEDLIPNKFVVDSASLESSWRYESHVEKENENYFFTRPMLYDLQ